VYRYVHKNLNVYMIRSFHNNEHASCKRHFNPEHILMLVWDTSEKSNGVVVHCAHFIGDGRDHKSTLHLDAYCTALVWLVQRSTCPPGVWPDQHMLVSIGRHMCDWLACVCTRPWLYIRIGWVYAKYIRFVKGAKDYWHSRLDHYLNNTCLTSYITI
jgi:hypothetical protein